MRRDEPTAEQLRAPGDWEMHDCLDEGLNRDCLRISDTDHHVRIPLEDPRVDGRREAKHISARVDRDIAPPRLVASVGDLEDINEHRGIESVVDNRRRRRHVHEG